MFCAGTAIFLGAVVSFRESFEDLKDNLSLNEPNKDFRMLGEVDVAGSIENCIGREQTGQRRHLYNPLNPLESSI